VLFNSKLAALLLPYVVGNMIALYDGSSMNFDYDFKVVGKLL